MTIPNIVIHTFMEEIRFMQGIIKINDPALDKENIQAQLQTDIAHLSIPDLAQTGPKKLHHKQQRTSGSTKENNIPHFTYTFTELIDNTAIKEPEFSSDAPIISPLIIKFRQLWNWMSTRWYVLPIIKQQSDVNMQMALMLMEMTQLQTLNASRIIDLKEQINNLEEHLSSEKEQ